jgi:hypothetical protein
VTPGSSVAIAQSDTTKLCQDDSLAFSTFGQPQHVSAGPFKLEETRFDFTDAYRLAMRAG